MANGLIVSLTSNNDKDEVGIAHGFNSFATIDAPAEGNTSLIRYFHDGEFDVSVKDTNGDGMPDRMLK